MSTAWEVERSHVDRRALAGDDLQEVVELHGEKPVLPKVNWWPDFEARCGSKQQCATGRVSAFSV